MEIYLNKAWLHSTRFLMNSFSGIMVVRTDYRGGWYRFGNAYKCAVPCVTVQVIIGMVCSTGTKTRNAHV